jgi:4-amino-4-deoxy-L-arabinose transferase-like glycosyltransferase
MHTNPAKTDTRLSSAFFWVTALFLIFWNLGARSLWGAEGRWAEVVREMIMTGDFFHPTIVGLPYFDKPLGSYWLIALTVPFTGLNEWAVRIPSAICAIIALLAVRQIGAQLWSPTTGRLAGWILLTTQGFLFWARVGAADMANLACSIAAVAWYWQRRECPNFYTFLVFYLLLFIGAQMKGLTAIIVPLLALTPDLLRGHRWRRYLGWQQWLALGVGLLVYILPFLYASITSADYSSNGITLVVRENIQRFFNPFDHIEPFYIYLKHVPVLFLPWSPLLVIALIMAIRHCRRGCSNQYDRWLMWAMLLIFLFFSASGSRRSYYILPILPFCALFCSVWMLKLESHPAGQRWLTKPYIWLSGLIFIAVPAAAAIWLLYQWQAESPLLINIKPAAALAVMLLLAVWLPWMATSNFWPKAAGLPTPIMRWVATIAICLGGYFCITQPLLEQYRTEKTFAIEVKATGRSADQTAFFEHYLENVVFYMDMTPAKHRVIKEAQEVYDYLQGEPGRIIILRQKHLPKMLAVFPPDHQGHAVLEEKVWPWQTGSKAGKKMVAWSL